MKGNTVSAEMIEEIERRIGYRIPPPNIDLLLGYIAEREAKAKAEAADDIEWAEKGLAEWRDLAQSRGRHAEAARATARVAIGHLQAVLNTARTHAEQQAADTAARDWLISIGSEPR